MLNKYPLWKYLLVLFVVAIGLLYAAPNLYAPDPALQITGESSAQVIDDATLTRATRALEEAGIEHFDEVIDPDGRNALIRLRDAEQQLTAQARVSRALGDGFIVALNLAPTTPEWLTDVGAQPMKLGLDLSGGVHFKLEVDIAAAIERRQEYYLNATKRALREERIRGLVTLDDQGRVVGQFRSEDLREQARSIIADNHPELALDRVDEYRRSGVPMLPVTHGDMHTRWNIFCYTVLLGICAVTPYFVGSQGLLYLVSVTLLSLIFLGYAGAVLNKRPGSEMGMFRYSIVYLGLLFAAVLIDHHSASLLS